MTEYIANTDPEWQRGKKTIAEIWKLMHRMKDERIAAEPGNIVFEYSENVSIDQAYGMRRTEFSDGRHRIILNPAHRKIVEAWVEKSTGG